MSLRLLRLVLPQGPLLVGRLEAAGAARGAALVSAGGAAFGILPLALDRRAARGRGSVGLPRCNRIIALGIWLGHLILHPLGVTPHLPPHHRGGSLSTPQMPRITRRRSC